MEFLSNWQQPLLWASGLSLLALIATIVGVPWVVTRLPKDYYSLKIFSIVLTTLPATTKGPVLARSSYCVARSLR